MTPDDLRQALIPRLAAMAADACLCSNPTFRKTLSFDFADYGIAPTALADAEILIGLVLRDEQRYRGVPTGAGVDSTCLRCGAPLSERYDDYNIHLSRSTVAWPERGSLRGSYCVGFVGFDAGDFRRIDDFDRIGIDEFIGRLGLAG